MTAQRTSGVPSLSSGAYAPVSLRRRLRAVLELGHVAGILLDRLRAALDAFEAERERRALMRELHTLDDWMLADIGVRRDEIETVVGGEQPRSPPKGQVWPVRT
jgi:uncharacterized protein YjiS (DUF1127 family)